MLKIYIDNRSIILCDKGSIYSTNAQYVKSADEVAAKYSIFVKAGALTAADSKLILQADSFNDLKDWFFSMFTIIEAAGGLVKAGDKYLFIFRRKTWDLPKGKIDDGETIEEAGIREVEEECGVRNLQLKEQLCTTYHIYEWKGKTILKPNYWFLMTTDECKLIPETEEDIELAEWRTADQLSDILENTFPSIVDVLSKTKLL